jgi:S-adenosyl methyltransferase
VTDHSSNPSEPRPDDRPDPPTDPKTDSIDIAGDVAHRDRVYDYVRGGTDNFAVDRNTAEYASASSPGGLEHARAAVQANEAFHVRTVTYLTGLGVRQFIEIGARIPGGDTTHEIAQRIAPDCRVVYANNDPVVLAHAHTLRKSTREGSTDYVDGDPEDPEAILDKASATIDLEAPVGVLLSAFLYHVRDEDDPWGIVARYMAPVPSGSYLVISHLTSDIIADQVTEAARRVNAQPGFTLNLRTHAEISRFFDGLELVPPGVVPIDQWGTSPSQQESWPIPFYGAVGRKP